MQTLVKIGNRLLQSVLPMSPETQLLCRIDCQITCIAAVTNIPIPELEKGIMVVGLQASLYKADYIYEMACAGEDVRLLL